MTIKKMRMTDVKGFEEHCLEMSPKQPRNRQNLQQEVMIF